MFTKLKSFSEDVAKSFNEHGVHPGAPNGRSTNAINELKKEAKVLSTKTPDPSDLSQPEDEVEPGSETLNTAEAELPEQEVPGASPPAEGTTSTAAPVDTTANSTIDLNELPPPIRSKMKKFAKYEEKYPILLDAYKTERRKSELIVGFERVLQENTPISSISDAGLLVEYLTGLNDKTTLLNTELRKYSKDILTLTKAKQEISANMSQLEQKYKESNTKLLDAEKKAAELEKLESKLKELSTKIAELEAKEQGNPDSAANDEEIAKLKEHIVQLESKVSTEDEETYKAALADTKSELSIEIQRSDKLESELALKKKEYEDLEKKLNEAEQSNINLTSEISTLDQASSKQKEDSKLQIQELTAKLNALKDAESAQTKEKDSLTAELALLKEKSIPKEDTSSIEKISELNQLLEKSRSENTELSEKLSSTVKELERAQKVATVATVASEPASPVNRQLTKNQKKKKNNGKKGNANAVAIQNTEATSSISEIQEEYTKIETLLKEVTEAKETISKEFEEAKLKYESILDLNKELIESNKTLSSSLALKNEDVENLRDSLRDIGDDLVSARITIKELKKNTDLGEGTQQLQAEVEKLTKLNNELEESKSKLIQSNTEEVQTLKVSETSLKSTLAQKTTELAKALEDFNRTSDELESTISKHSETLAKVKQSESGFKSANELLNTENGKLKKELESLSKEVLNLKNEKEALNERIKKLNNYKSNDTSLKLEIASLKTSLNHKDVQIEEYKSKISDLSQERQKLVESIASLKSSVKDLQVSNKAALHERNRLLSEHEDSIEKSKSLANELGKLQTSKQGLGDELEKIKSKFDVLTKEKQHSTNEYQILKQQYEELSMETKESSNRIESLEDELAEVKNMLQERVREASTIRRFLLEAEDQLKAKEADHAFELQKASEETSQVKSSYQLIVKKNQREIDEFKSINENYLLKIQELESSLESVKQQKEELDDDLSSGINGNEMESNELQKTIDTLRNSLQEAFVKQKESQHLNSVLKKLNEESNLKFERVSKNYKILTQQYRQIKTASESTPPSTDLSPRNSSDIPHSVEEDKVNVAYLKNVLLGFFEHKDQREMLLPVVKTIFNLSQDDEKKLLQALK